jgi:hypothetical protein
MTTLKKQSINYIDADIKNTFHILELKGQHNFLIGSNSIRNMLYANDYDLNSNIQISGSKTIVTKVYEEFLYIFDTAYQNPDYYILDFKCGHIDGEPIRWSYHDLQEGSIKHKNRTITFEDCLLMDDNLIKLDICFLNNGIMTDINCLYNIYIAHSHKELLKEKLATKNDIIISLKEEIQELEKTKEFYKAMKRYFSLELLEGKVDESILEIMNSDLGMFYKFISSLRLVSDVIEQDFRPINIEIVKSNLELIKQFGSHITSIKVDPYIDILIKITSMKTKSKIKSALDNLADKCSNVLNNLVK